MDISKGIVEIDNELVVKLISHLSNLKKQNIIQIKMASELYTWMDHRL